MGIRIIEKDIGLISKDLETIIEINDNMFSVGAMDLKDIISNK